MTRPISSVSEAHRAIKRGDVSALREALSSGAIDVSNGYLQTSCTLLHIAALHGDTAIGQLLCEFGSDVNATNKFGGTPLEDAITKGNTSFVRFLLNHGAVLEPVKDRSIDVHIDWAERCSGVSPKTAKQIRELIHSARELRNSPGS